MHINDLSCICIANIFTRQNNVFQSCFTWSLRSNSPESLVVISVKSVCPVKDTTSSYKTWLNILLFAASNYLKLSSHVKCVVAMH